MKPVCRWLAIALTLALLMLGGVVGALSETVTVLPASLEIIEEEAFYGSDALDRVILPEGVREIRDRAFANSGLREINLPDSLTYISDSAFDGPQKVTVSANSGTYAFRWAANHGYTSVYSITPLTLNENTTVVIDRGGDIAYFSFTPSESGSYRFYSLGEDVDSYGYLYDSDMNALDSDDDGGGNLRFRIDCELSAGTRYNFGARFLGKNETGTFTVRLEKMQGLVRAWTENDEVSIEPGQSAELRVNVQTAGEAQLSYQWQTGKEIWDAEEDDYITQWTDIPGATAETYTASGGRRYRCLVNDDLGHQENVRFWVYVDNDFTLERVGESKRYVTLGETETLEVEASRRVGELHFQWYRVDEDTDREVPILGATSASYTTEPVTGYVRYRCVVSDDYGNSDYCNVYVYVDNGFTVQAVGDEDVYVKPNQSVTFEVEANCDEGSLTYRWYDENAEEYIEGATSATYTIEAVTEYCEYYCEVSDKYGNSQDIWFYVYVDNGFTAQAVGDNNVYVTPGQSATLEVEASCDEGSLTYQWYDDYTEESIAGATSATYTIGAVTGRCDYYCRVSDNYGNSRNIWFYVYVDNGFTAQAVGNNNVYVTPGQSVTLEVNANCNEGSLTYRWYDENAEEYIEGATSATYTIGAVTGRCDYYCRVSDNYGNSQDIWFYVYVDNGFTAQAVGDNNVYVTPGQSVTLEVEASCDEGDLTYSWARYSQIQGQGTGSSWKWTDIPDATEPRYTFIADGAINAYQCSVSDDYGNSETCQFRILLCDTNAALPLTLDTDATANVDYPGKFVLFSFTPQASGSYVFYSQWDDDSYGYLFDGNMIEIADNDDDGEDSNFRIECELQADTLYYFGARCYSSNATGSIPVRLEKVS